MKMEKWKMPDENEDEEVDEDDDSENAEEESEEDSLVETPVQSFVRRADAEQIKPFLETEPIENLEQDLQNIPPARRPAQDNAGDYAENVINYGDAAAYDSAIYQSGNYEQAELPDRNAPKIKIEQARTLIDIPRTELGFERDINMKAQRREAMAGYPGEERRQRQRDYTPSPQRFQQDTTGLPFQDKNPRDRRLRRLR